MLRLLRRCSLRLQTKALGSPVSPDYIKYMVPGIALLIVFAIIIPAFWFLVLWYHRNQLDVSTEGGWGLGAEVGLRARGWGPCALGVGEPGCNGWDDSGGS